MSTYWMSESLFSDHPTWRRQQRGPFYTTIYILWSFKGSRHRENQLGLDMDTLGLQISPSNSFGSSMCSWKFQHTLRSSDKWNTKEPTIWASWIWWLDVGIAYLWCDNETSFVFPSLAGGYSNLCIRGKLKGTAYRNRTTQVAVNSLDTWW